MERYRICKGDEVPADVLNRLQGYDPLDALMLWHRGVCDADAAERFLHPQRGDLHDPFLFTDMRKAVDLLYETAAEIVGSGDGSVCVFGDYDADGICASALLSGAVRRWAAECFPAQKVPVRVYNPSRGEGYGLNKNALSMLRTDGCRLILTVDLGITNHEEVRFAQSLGMRVIVTDHHEPGVDPSPADAVINPKADTRYPFTGLCGTGVAFQLARALLGADNCDEWLDLVAIATVTDMVPLRDENRCLVRAGLERINQHHVRPGVDALIKVSRTRDGAVDAETIAFQLGPRLNAVSRMCQTQQEPGVNPACRLMCTSDPVEAERLAMDVEELNLRRRSEQRDVEAEADRKAAGHDFCDEPCLIVYGENWNPGLVGLAAGNLCQRYGCPVCVLTLDAGTGLMTGSLRSVKGVHIQHCLQKTDEAHILERYGGHEMAAGVTLHRDHFEEFSRRLCAAIAEEVRLHGTDCLIPTCEYEAEVPLSYWSERFDDLDRLEEWKRGWEPCGTESPAPVFRVRNAQSSSARTCGEGGKHLQMTLCENGTSAKCIAFGMGALAADMPPYPDVLYVPQRNEFNGRVNLQLSVRALNVPAAQRYENLNAKSESERRAPLLMQLCEWSQKQAHTPAMEKTSPQIQSGMDAYGQAGDRQSAPDTAADCQAALKNALLTRQRGTLFIVRTAESAHQALTLTNDMHAEPLPLYIGAADNPQCFAALLFAPLYDADADQLCADGQCWHHVWLCDGEAFAGEKALWQRHLPNASIHVPPVSAALQANAKALLQLMSPDALRPLYKSILKVCGGSLSAGSLRRSAGVPFSGAELHAALTVFAQAGLIDYAREPFFCRRRTDAPHNVILSQTPLMKALAAIAANETEAGIG